MQSFKPTRASPHIRIRPASGLVAIDLHELWAYRDLFLILMLRDVKVRYKQTMLGVAWVILQPLAAALIFAVIFGKFARLPSENTPYILLTYAAMLPWNVFSGAIQRAGTSLLSDSKLISKVYFPRILIPLASSTAVLVDFAVSFCVWLGLLLIYGIYPAWQMLAFLPLLLIVLVATFGVSLFFSALNVYYRDFMYALPFLIQVWMYLSPIAYTSEIIPSRYKIVYAINPLVGVVDGFRWAFLGTGDFPSLSLSLSLVVSMLLFLGGTLVFQRIEQNFADVI